MGSGASMAVESSLDAGRLAERCLPFFEKCGLPKVKAVDSVSTHCIQRLWTGMGAIDEVIVKAPDGAVGSFIVKHVGTPKDLINHEYKRDHESYVVEASFYKQGHANRLSKIGALCPRLLYIDEAEFGILRICMTKLPGEDLDRDDILQVKSALSWLAKLHSMYWGRGLADKAVATGLQPQGCYWHFDTRQLEHGQMSRDGIDGRLRLAAKALDERLKAEVMQTICHGDPKAPNTMFDQTAGISFFDFQWTGKAPPSKDLAYFIACGAGPDLVNSVDSEHELLQYYHGELIDQLERRGDALSSSAPSFEDLWHSYELACADLARWMAGWGWWGNKILLQRHVSDVLEKLDGGEELDSDEAYCQRINAAFPIVESQKPKPKVLPKVVASHGKVSPALRSGSRVAASSSRTSKAK